MIISLIAALSADGRIAQSENQNSTDWTSKEDLAFFVRKTKEIGTVVIGRRTFDTIGKPLKGRRMIVMTRKPRQSTFRDEDGSVEYTNASPAELVAKLEKEGVKELAVCGGSQIYSSFLQAGLVNDLYLSVEPVLFGSGVAFGEGYDRINMTLADVERLSAQTVLLHYRVTE